MKSILKFDSMNWGWSANVKSDQSTLSLPDIDLCSACHVYPISRGAWIVSILFIVNRFAWGLN